MDIKECYKEMGGDYEDIFFRLKNISLITKIVKKFNDDQSFNELEKALNEKNVEEAFRAAHTLKGICLNLSFKQLKDDTVEITEILRAGSFEGTDELFKKIKEEYKKTVETIKQLD